MYKPLMRELCNTAVENHSFAKNDVLFRSNQEAKCMYFVTQGSLIYRYRSSANKWGKHLETAKLCEEQWATEAVLWMPWVHKGVLRVLSDADILYLASAKFRDVTATSPDTFMLAHRYALNYLVHVQIVEEQDGLTDVSPEFLLAFADGEDAVGGELLKEIREAEEIEARLVALKDDSHGVESQQSLACAAPVLRTESSRSRFLTTQVFR
mmetsp:Transcript_65901/g.121502  ORF Transcript_65901/g.121502 Transcript_65901/m.121502 type:complete len:210 (+) Transcript_65901:2-631(+)